MKYILKYLFFLVLGIILYILLNGNDGFSVGVPEYLLTIDNTIISIDTTIYSDHPETWYTSESNKVMKINENRYYVYGNDIDKARRNFDVYITNRQSMAGGNTIQDDSSYDSDTLLQSYSSCNPSITDDILSQLRCMFENGEIPLCDISRDATCHQSQRGLFPVVDKYYNPRGGDSVIRNLILGESYTWSRTNELLQSGGHYILEASIFSLHSFFIEFKEGKFRILSLWEGIYGFLEFPPMSIWGNFYGHDDYNAFLDKLKLINGGDDVDLDTSGDNNFSKYRMTEDEARISTDTINEIFASRVDWNTEMFDSNWNQKGLLQQPKYIIHLESEPSAIGGGGAIGGGACSVKNVEGEVEGGGRGEVEEEVIRNLMTPATREYLSGPGSNWISTTMGFGSAIDKYLLTCIKALITSRGGYGKQVVFVGQAYFILQSLFFINSTLIFFDINIHLLEAMKTIIDNFKDMTSFDDLFSNMERINLREVYKSQSDLRKVKELLSIDNERILFQRCKQNFRNNTYVLCEASITDEPLLDYLKNYELDYFSVTNLPVYVIPNFWETINRLQTNNPNLLFMATDRVATNQIIFQYDNSQISIFTTNNPNIFDMQLFLGGKGWLDRKTSFYAQYDLVKYVYIDRNEELLTLKNTL
jgi:hypothetical protein